MKYANYTKKYLSQWLRRIKEKNAAGTLPKHIVALAQKKGVDLTSPRAFMSFEKARKLVRSWNLNDKTQWVDRMVKTHPVGLPRYPNKIYAESGWVSWQDFLKQAKSSKFTVLIVPMGVGKSDTFAVQTAGRILHKKLKQEFGGRFLDLTK